MRRTAASRLLTALLAAIWGVGAARTPAAQVASPAPSMTTSTAAGPADSLSDSPIRPGDILRLRIYREPDLSGDFPVDHEGIAVLPKIGPRNVTARNPDSVRSEIIREYVRLLAHQSVSLIVLRRVQVLGAVRNPGLYPLDATMSVSDALAMAGGPTPQGNQRRIELIRSGRRVGARLDPGSSIGASQVRSGDQIYVPERNWLSRNPGIVGALITGIVTLAIALLR